MTNGSGSQSNDTVTGDPPDTDPGQSFDVARFIQETRQRSEDSEQEVREGSKRLLDIVDAENQRRVGQDRSLISGIIIGTYAIVIITALVYVLGRFPECTPEQAENCKAVYNAWETQSAVLRDLITTAVLPIVTLMLGFYFGTETAKKSQGDPD